MYVGNFSWKTIYSLTDIYNKNKTRKSEGREVETF